MNFANLLWLAAVLAVLPVAYFARRSERIKVAGFGIHRSSPGGRLIAALPMFLYTAALVLTAVALTQPFVKVDEKTTSTVQGRDIILALDWSASMAEPYKGERKVRKPSVWFDPYAKNQSQSAVPSQPANPDGEHSEQSPGEFRRIDAAQDAIVSFAETRLEANTGDHIALILFDHKPELRWPLDRDLKQITRHSSFLPKGKGPQELGVGTNFGTTIPGPIDKAAEHFELRGKSSTRVLILITDGENEMDDKVMARLLEVVRKAHMRLYVIGVGEKIGQGELSLERLCRDASGEVFRAETQTDLDKCFAAINALESSPIPVVGDKFFEPVFYYFLVGAMCFYVLSLFSEAVILGR